MGRSILCVSDQEDTLNICKDIFKSYNPKWGICYAENLRSALILFEQNPFDLVVADARMAGNDGLTLLNGIMRSAPLTNRIAIADDRNRQYLKNSLNLVHQWVMADDLKAKLRGAVERVLVVSDICGSQDIKDLLSEIEVIPSIPSLYKEMLQLLNDDEASIHDVGHLIASDIAMTAKVLQLVNSAFFGLCRRIHSAEEAAVFIGIDTLKGLVLSLQAFAALSVDGISDQYVDEMWRHAVTTAAFARSVAMCETKDKELINSAFTAGMLHDIGRLLLMDNMPKKYLRYVECLSRDTEAEIKLERIIFGATHQEIGAYLLNTWGLPNSIVDPVLFHHNPPQRVEGFSPTVAVSVADTLYYDLVGTSGARPRSKSLAYKSEVSDVKSQTWVDACVNVLE